MEKELKGLTSEEVEQRIKEGKVNVYENQNLKTNGQIIKDNVCTLFNLFNLIIAIALACVHAYTNMVFMARDGYLPMETYKIMKKF